jgi:hypothetical protein
MTFCLVVRALILSFQTLGPVASPGHKNAPLKSHTLVKDDKCNRRFGLSSFTTKQTRQPQNASKPENTYLVPISDDIMLIEFPIWQLSL